MPLSEIAAYMLNKSLADTWLLLDRKRRHFPDENTSEAVIGGASN